MTHDELNTLLQTLGLKIDAEFVPRSKTDNAKATILHEMKINWRVTISREGSPTILLSPYSQGIGHLPKAIRPRNQGRVTTAEYDALIDALETGRVMGVHGMPGKLPTPKLADVLYCLVMDSSALDHPNFEAWAREYDYDIDSRSAERAYRTCLMTALTLRAMLGDENLARLRDAFQDY